MQIENSKAPAGNPYTPANSKKKTLRKNSRSHARDYILNEAGTFYDGLSLSLAISIFIYRVLSRVCTYTYIYARHRISAGPRSLPPYVVVKPPGQFASHAHACMYICIRYTGMRVSLRWSASYIRGFNASLMRQQHASLPRSTRFQRSLRLFLFRSPFAFFRRTTVCFFFFFFFFPSFLGREATDDEIAKRG